MARIASGGGPIHVEARIDDRVGERRPLGEEPVSRMDRVSTARGRRLEQARDVEVALRRRRRPDVHRAIGGLHVRTGAIGVGVHRHRLDAVLVTGAHDPQGDLPAVRYQDSFHDE